MSDLDFTEAASLQARQRTATRVATLLDQLVDVLPVAHDEANEKFLQAVYARMAPGNPQQLDRAATLLTRIYRASPPPSRFPVRS